MGPDVFAEVEALGVIPVVDVEDAAHAVPLARTLTDAGLPVLEVTFRTPAAGDAVDAIAAEFPGFLLGAGTLLTPDSVALAVAAGARFGVSPGVSPRCIAAAAEREFPFIPGALTPSEVITCLDCGADHIKFFPAGAYGGVPTLSALAGPFAATGVRFMPTGGIDASNAADYLRLPHVFAVGGTWIAPRNDIAQGRWTEIAERARSVAALSQSVEAR
jgi:2-dehydro-3-deoxyphosphogluconate aldolase / (4S)-4-hydroxy-2-oxoglutarate aldolase